MKVFYILWCLGVLLVLIRHNSKGEPIIDFADTSGGSGSGSGYYYNRGYGGGGGFHK